MCSVCDLLGNLETSKAPALSEQDIHCLPQHISQVLSSHSHSSCWKSVREKHSHYPCFVRLCVWISDKLRWRLVLPLLSSPLSYSGA